MAPELVVFLGSRMVGVFSQDRSGRQSFRYDPGWLERADSGPLSLSLPLRPEPFDDAVTRAFFSGLLPDDQLRRRLGQYLGVSANNEFALLAEVGRECAGAVSILPKGTRPFEAASGHIDPPARVLEDGELLGVLEELPRRPLFVGDELRLSLAGAQDKMAVRIIEGRVALPLGGQPSTHILKTPIADFESTVENEFFCMRLAAKIGLSVPPVAVRTVVDRSVLLVDRYDRVPNEDEGAGEAPIVRLHQEDCCQALGIPPSLKYQSEGGPSLPDVFGLLADHALRPAVDRLALLRWVVFNFLIGNADAHGKNVSLLHRTGGVWLAPFYDLMCTLVYPSLTTRMAMKIGSKYPFEQVERRHWEAMARESGLAPAQVVRIALETARELPGVAAGVMDEAGLAANRVVGRIRDGLEDRAGRLVQRLS